MAKAKISTFVTNKRYMLKRAITIIYIAVAAVYVQAQTAVRFGNEASDTTVINGLLDSRGASQNFVNPEARVSFFARSLLSLLMAPTLSKKRPRCSLCESTASTAQPLSKLRWPLHILRWKTAVLGVILYTIYSVCVTVAEM